MPAWLATWRSRTRLGAVAVLCTALAGAEARAQAPVPSALAAADSARAEIDRSSATGDLLRLERTLAFLEQALAVHPSEPWLDHYVGFANFRAANLRRVAGDERAERTHLERAEKALLRSADRMPLAETYALLAAVRGRMITGMISAMRMGPRSDQALDRALELGPRNPRVWAIRASSMLFRPRMFGGSPEKAEEYARRAIELLAMDSVAIPGPRWGESDAYMFLGQALAAQKKHAGARAAYERVLELEPANAYVRDVLMAALPRGRID